MTPPTPGEHRQFRRQAIGGGTKHALGTASCHPLTHSGTKGVVRVIREGGGNEPAGNERAGIGQGR